jgi:hypothetical protein
VGAVFSLYVIQPIQGFWLGLTSWVNRALDDSLEAILLFGKKSVDATRGIPVLGGAFGGIADLSGASGAIDEQLAQISQRRNDRERAAALDRKVAAAANGVNVSVNQTITAPSPQVAAAAANRGVGTAVSRAVPGAGRVGAPLVKPTKP